METRFALHKPVIPLLRAMLKDSKTSQVVDLCSGGGGPMLAIYESLVARGIRVRITLTDKDPNLEAFARLSSLYPSDILYIANSVDARKVPRELIGLRTIFNSFHHLYRVKRVRCWSVQSKRTDRSVSSKFRNAA
jgi:hypothetical protein